MPDQGQRVHPEKRGHHQRGEAVCDDRDEAWGEVELSIDGIGTLRNPVRAV